MFNNFFKTTKAALIEPSVVIQDTSSAKSLDSTDFGKLAAHVLIGAAVAALTIIGEKLASIDMGMYTALIIPLGTALISTAQKWLRDHDNG